jgi:integrase
MAITYRVRFNRIEPRVNAKGEITSYRVHWTVEKERMKETFGNATQAGSFASTLKTAISEGKAFDTETGLPVGYEQQRKRSEPVRWYAFAVQYAAAKWPYASPNHRRGISESLTDATEVLVEDRGAPPRAALRKAMLWATSTHIEQPDADPPADLAETVRWLEQHTVPMSAFEDKGGKGTELARRVLDRINRKQDGKVAKMATFLRKRAVLSNLAYYAIELEVLSRNPFKVKTWVKPRTSDEVNWRTVPNHEQAGRLLAVLPELGEMGSRLEAFFGNMYYIGFRPEENMGLMVADLIELPDEGWGWVRLSGAEPMPGRRWTGNGTARERRALKHRADKATRLAPIHPDQVARLKRHLKEFPTADGYVFRGPRGGKISDSTYLPYFHKARKKAFTKPEAASPLAEVPYTLRHAAVSQWLAAGVSPKQVAQWAGMSLKVLMDVYAQRIPGNEQHEMRKIEDSLKPPPPPKAEPEKGEEEAS